MGYFRFHRSLELLPLTRLNLSKRGASVSFGVPGARYNIGAQETRATVGIPGTGLSYIERSGATAPAPEGNWLIGLIEFIALCVVALVVIVAIGALTMWPLGAIQERNDKARLTHMAVAAGVPLQAAAKIEVECRNAGEMIEAGWTPEKCMATEVASYKTDPEGTLARVSPST